MVSVAILAILSVTALAVDGMLMAKRLEDMRAASAFGGAAALERFISLGSNVSVANRLAAAGRVGTLHSQENGGGNGVFSGTTFTLPPQSLLSIGSTGITIELGAWNGSTFTTVSDPANVSAAQVTLTGPAGGWQTVMARIFGQSAYSATVKTVILFDAAAAATGQNPYRILHR